VLPSDQSSRRGWSILPQGDRCLILVFGQDIQVDTGRRCALAAAALRAARLSGITDIVPTFNTVALHFQPEGLGKGAGIAQLASEVNHVLDAAMSQEQITSSGKQVEIPVCYGGEHGPDLQAVADYCKLDPAEVIRLHSHEPAYVFMLGFAPGAPYIGVHDPKLSIGRRDTPRTLLPAGSVAIANLQTMIYPNASPGGWNIIGATPVVLFDPTQDPPTLLQPGDTVKFVPIDAQAFQALRQETA